MVSCIVAIHGLGTESPRTWEYKKDGGGVVNWLADLDMLPAVIPQARIFTYDWDANYFRDAPVETLLGHSDTLLSLVARCRDTAAATRPLIFIASCFGGLILAQALVRSAQEGSEYRHLLQAAVGIAFLATPFRGSAAATEAQWQVVVGGIMEEQTSTELIDDLYERDKHLRDLTRTFAELARHDSMQLPLCCFYESKKTKILRRFLSSSWANVAARAMPGFYKILVAENSACLDTVRRVGLDATHSGMNKFSGPDSSNFQLLRQIIRGFVDQAPKVLERREKSSHQSQWLVPLGRNPDFVERREIMDQLLELINPAVEKDHCQRTAIEGLGGVGKTQLALEAAYLVRDRDPDCSVFWVTAVDVTSFENAYREIGQKLQVTGIDDDGADVKLLVKKALSRESCGRWFLIIDNTDDVQLLFGTPRLCDYLPSSSKGSILFTTRNHKAASKLDIAPRNIITATEMSETEALGMLQRNLKERQICDGDSTHALLKLLTHLPLAIKQASAYMAETDMTTTRYLHHCRSSDQRLINLLSRENEYQGRQGVKNTVATTWLVSFNHILRDQPRAADILRMVCFMVDKGIPSSLFLQGEDELAMDEAIGTLKAYAFLTEREDHQSFDIHRLVQLAMRNWLQQERQQETWIKTAVQRIVSVYPFPTHENRQIWERYLPHASSVVSFHELDAKEAGDIRLLVDIATSYALLGKYREAEEIHRQSLAVGKEVLGEEHPGTLAIMNDLAEALRQQGEYEEAEQIHRQTMDGRKKVLGESHSDVLISMGNLALVLWEQGKYQEGEQMLRQTLAWKKKMLGDEHPLTLGSMNNLAIVSHQQGEYKEAEQVHRRTFALMRKVFGEEHPNTLASMNNLADALRKQGHYQEAEQIHRQTWDLKQKSLGGKHPDTLTSINSLAMVLRDKGEYREAEEMCRQTLSLRKKLLKEEHPATLDSIGNLASVLQQQGKYKEAEELHRQTLSTRKKVLGEEHPDTLASMNDLAVALRQQGKYEEAEIIYGETLHLRKKVLGEEHPDTLDSMHNLALVLYQKGKYKEAEIMHGQTLSLRKKVLKEEHPATLDSIGNLASVLQQQGKYKEAEELHRQTLSTRKKVLGENHPDTLASMGNLAVVLQLREKYEEAEEMHRQTLILKTKALRENHPSALDSMNNLAVVLWQQKRYEEAEEIHWQTLSLRRKVLGDEHPDTLASMNNLAELLRLQGKHEEAKQIFQ